MPPPLPSRPVHLEAERVERFLRGELAAPEVRAVVRHLLTRCPRCVAVAAAVTGRSWSFGEAGGRHDGGSPG